MKDKKVIFMGTPLFAVPILEALIKNTTVVGVVTQPDKEVGRKKVLTPSPIKVLASENNILVFQPKRIKSEYEEINKLDADIIITCAYGQIIPEEVIYHPAYNTINVHASLLPKYRGGAPIQRAIMNGEDKTGITIMKTDEGMDTGNIIQKESLIIEDSDNYETLSKKLSLLGAELLIKVLPDIFNKNYVEEKQNEEEVSYADLIRKEDEHLNINKTAFEVLNYIRALSPNPGAYVNINNERVKIYEAYIKDAKIKKSSIINNIYNDGIALACCDKEIVVTKLQVSGKKIMMAKDYINGIDKNLLVGEEVK